MVEGGVNHARLHSICNFDTQHGFSCTTVDAYPVSLFNTALLCIVWMDFNQVFMMPTHIFSTAGLRTYIVLGKDTARG